jgi:hypothetical protein
VSALNAVVGQPFFKGTDYVWQMDKESQSATTGSRYVINNFNQQTPGNVNGLG